MRYASTHSPHWRAVGCLALLLSLCVVALAGSEPTPSPAVVSIFSGTGLWGGSTSGELTPSDPVLKLIHTDHSLTVQEWSGIKLPGGAGRTPLMMSIAGQTAPDVLHSYFHMVRNDISQGFLAPLNEWVGPDTNKNGQIDDTEITWPGWRQVPPLWRQVATVDGKVYALPVASTSHLGIIYRLDLVKRAGLDPDNPPKTWDEFLYWCQRLTDPDRGTRGFVVFPYCFTWLPWMQSTGGSPVMQIKVSPTTGKSYTFPMDALTFRAPDTGEDLARVPSAWKADLASPAAERAMAFYHRLRWQHWIRDPQTREPLNLTPEQEKAGRVVLPSGREVRFTKDKVIVGAVLTTITSPGQPAQDWGRMLARGEVAMALWFFDDLTAYQTMSGINPRLLGVFPVPAGPGGKPVIQIQRHYASMSEGVARRPKRERDAVWKVMQAITSPAAYDEWVRGKVLSGQARFVRPNDLVRLGFKDYVNEVPHSLRNLFAGIENGEVLERTEPFMGFWAPAGGALENNVISLLLSTQGETLDYRKALHDVDRMANEGMMFSRRPEDIAPYRPLAYLIGAVVLLVMLLFVTLIVKANLSAPAGKPAASQSGVHRAWVPWLMLVPALGLIALWGYYPLGRGMLMAFQDYHIVGQSPWVGLDNFINIFLNPDFYVYVRQTIKFVIINLLLVFTAPILLSLFLSEIPKGKVFWRTVFFLPQLTSGLVVMLLWKLMYNPTESGLLNQLLHLCGLKAVDWLGSTDTAMVATILPSVWAGMGISSLIYLAALKGIPDELYEAAALDGAGIFAKLRYVTIPQLMPLIIINFVGAFIATFQSMGNIFLLTFGGPGKETMVLSMAIWIEAYNNLRFSMATSMAWVLGSALIGFAYLQIRMLRRVEFRRVEEV